MEMKIGDSFSGNDCHGELVSGEISKIMTNSFIVINGAKSFVVKKNELTEINKTFPTSDNKKY
ncbi:MULTISPECIES: hypothetical protein [unclassified Enterococcus]|uniref:hypothetical protein n=1 Tax=unclassified Enterococcus TaxID=2608891 RepID=UPI000A3314E1|nr:MULTISPECIES: hypothetical protein [unclassified Enterococcus]OTO67565.1 hypothetical protein A5865_003244 [Enterococcus sp. 12E11_DIV0728]OUZ15503.1 hypothetical protein A5868_000414 [Enterococcus sp. 12F9_DIV0723]